MSNVRECPFCGGAVNVDRGWTVEDPIKIHCPQCGAVFTSYTRYNDPVGQFVLEGWNTRHADKELAVLRAENLELTTMVCDLLNQACQVRFDTTDRTAIVDHLCLSDYEEAYNVLEQKGLLVRMSGRQAKLSWPKEASDE